MYEKIERVSDQKYPRVLKTEYFTDGKGNCEVSQYWDDVHKWSMECESPIKNGNNLDNKLDELETILNENP